MWVNSIPSIYNHPYNLPWYPGWPNATEAFEAHDYRVGIPTFEVENINSKESLKIIKKINPDIIILVSTGLIKEKILKLPRFGVFNVHNGILPFYRGMDAVAWAMLYNDNIGCTLHLVASGVDTGEIIAVELIDRKEAKFIKQSVKETQTFI